MRHRRQNHLDLRYAALQFPQGFTEDGHVMADFTAPASGQDQKHGRLSVAPFALMCVRPQQTDLLDQGMPYIGAGRTSEIAIGLGFKRQQRQDMIHIAAHRLRPAGSPGPHRRRNIVHDGQGRTPCTNALCHAMGKIGTVDDDKNVGRGRNHGIGGVANPPQDHRQLLHHRRKSHDRQLFDRKQRGQAFAHHQAAADALEAH